MKDQKFRRPSWQQLALSTEFDGIPPGGANRTATGSPPGKPTLTQMFNAAAKKPVLHDTSRQPVSRQQIAVLQRQMSQPRHTSEMTPLGSVLRSRNVEKDRRLTETITALTERLNKQKGLKQRFAMAEKKGHAKKQFNQAARGMGM